MTLFTWTGDAVASALETSPAGPLPEEGITFSGVSTDTRDLEPGSLFVALSGERFDAHRFLAEAVMKGAAGVVVSERPDADLGVPTYVVPDTLEALGHLARYRRRAFRGSVVAITGSAGKTTVKEILSAALSASAPVHATRGNLNNLVGLPLTLLRLPDEARYAVLEAGTSEPGEIGRLMQIAEPDHGILTTVSEAHLSGLGSFEGVLEEKLDLVRGVAPAGVVVVGDVPELLGERARGIRADVRIAGLSAGADDESRGVLQAQAPDGTYTVRFGDARVRSGIPGAHGARNLVLALALARALGVDLGPAARAASGVRPLPLRGEVRQVGGLTLLLDCYNANPQSVVAALELLAGLPGDPRRIAVLGSMLELGSRSLELHREVLDRARTLPIDLVIASGAFAAAVSKRGSGPEVVPADTVDAAYEALRPRIHGSETVLLKASRGVALETIVDRLIADFGGGAAGPDVPGRDEEAAGE